MAALKDQLSGILASLQSQGYDTRPLVFMPPASKDEVEALEMALGLTLPPAFKLVLTEISAHVEFCWFAPKRKDYPEPFDSNFCGDLRWSLTRIPELEADRRASIEAAFADEDDPYNAVWHQKLAFQEVGNGDYLAMDLQPETYGQIVYLSHDDGEGHGYVMAEDFIALLRRWVPVACTGAEDWQWLPFTASPGSGIDPGCENAIDWRKLIGLDAT